jgi:hypothetical protein
MQACGRLRKPPHPAALLSNHQMHTTTARPSWRVLAERRMGTVPPHTPPRKRACTPPVCPTGDECFVCMPGVGLAAGAASWGCAMGRGEASSAVHDRRSPPHGAVLQCMGPKSAPMHAHTPSEPICIHELSLTPPGRPTRANSHIDRWFGEGRPGRLSRPSEQPGTSGWHPRHLLL